MFCPICRCCPSLFDSLLGIIVKLAVTVSKLVHFSEFEHGGKQLEKCKCTTKYTGITKA